KCNPVRAVFDQRAEPLLALTQRLLGELSLRDIAGYHQHLVGFSALIEYDAALGFDVTQSAVAQDETVFRAPARAGGNRFFEDSPDVIAIIRMDFLERDRAAEGGRIAKEFLIGAAVVNPVAIDVQNRDEIGDVVGDKPEHLLALAESRFGVLLLQGE